MSANAINQTIIDLTNEGQIDRDNTFPAVVFREARSGTTPDIEGRLVGGTVEADAQMFMRYEGGDWMPISPGEQIRTLRQRGRVEFYWPAQAGVYALLQFMDPTHFEGAFRRGAL